MTDPVKTPAPAPTMAFDNLVDSRGKFSATGMLKHAWIDGIGGTLFVYELPDGTHLAVLNGVPEVKRIPKENVQRIVDHYDARYVRVGV